MCVVHNHENHAKMTAIFTDTFTGAQADNPPFTRGLTTSLVLGTGSLDVADALAPGSNVAIAIIYFGSSLVIPVGAIVRATWAADTANDFLASGEFRTACMTPSRTATTALQTTIGNAGRGTAGAFITVTESVVTATQGAAYTQIRFDGLVANRITESATVANAGLLTKLEIFPPADPICVSGDTYLMTPDGARAARDLAVGDLVSVRRYSALAAKEPAPPEGARDYLPITFASLQSMSSKIVRFPASSLGEGTPARDALVTVPHPILLEDRRVFAEAGLLCSDAAQRPAAGERSEGEPTLVPYSGEVYNFAFAEECAFEVDAGLFLAAELPTLGVVRDRLARTYLEGYEWRPLLGAPLRQRQSVRNDWYRAEDPLA
jgi:hypothetical protein